MLLPSPITVRVRSPGILPALLLGCVLLFASGCLRPEDREVAAPPDPAVAAAAAAAASEREAAVAREVAALSAELARRDTLLQAAALGHAELTLTLEEARQRSEELSTRLRTATTALERVSSELRARAEAEERRRETEEPITPAEPATEAATEPHLTRPADPAVDDTPVAGIPPLLDLE